MATLTCVPAAALAAGCSGADEPTHDDDPSTGAGEDAEETNEAGQAWAIDKCSPRKVKNAPGWDECRRGAPSGPTPQVCTLKGGGGGAAAGGFGGGPTDPGPDGFPDAIDRSW